jgi:hypothetical protein
MATEMNWSDCEMSYSGEIINRLSEKIKENDVQDHPRLQNVSLILPHSILLPQILEQRRCVAVGLDTVSEKAEEELVNGMSGASERTRNLSNLQHTGFYLRRQ